jgi:hypothetical protein
VINLFKAVKNYPGVDSVEISHFALSSVTCTPDLIEEISPSEAFIMKEEKTRSETPTSGFWK